MNRILLRIFLISPIFLLAQYISFSQNLTGIWRGYFTTDYGEHYRLEFQVEQSKSMSVSGVSYSYLDTRFYGKATMTGQFSRGSLRFKIQEIKTVEVRNLDGNGTCIMNYNFTYTRSGNEEFLEGDFLGKTEDRKNPKNNGKWGDCGGGKVFLRRVVSSDFYVEPFLREKPKPKINTSTNSATNKPNTKIKITTDKPAAKSNNNIYTKKNADKEIIKSNKKPTNDSARRRQTPIVKETAPGPMEKKLAINTPSIFKTRENEIIKTLFVKNDAITVKLYDNGEIDDDTISVYLDKQLVLSKERLSMVPLIVHLKMDEDNSEHELVMVAENLGRIPPNTSLMIVYSGDERHQVRITSTEQKNAVVRFVYQKPK